MANTVTFKTQKEDGTWKTWRNVVIPVKFGALLDEQLDYAVVSLARIKRKEFKPMSRATLTITSNTQYGGEQSKTMQYFIASDDNFETPIGSGEYNHELTLIELTKFLECFPLESLCFTNPNGNDYTKGAHEVKPEVYVKFGVSLAPSYNPTESTDIAYSRIDISPAPYLSPSIIHGTPTLFNLKKGNRNSSTQESFYYTGKFDNGNAVRVTNENGTTFYKINADGEIEGDNTFIIAEGDNIIEYSFLFTQVTAGAGWELQENSTFTIYGSPQGSPHPFAQVRPKLETTIIEY